MEGSPDIGQQSSAVSITLLEFLVKARAITDALRSRLPGWRHFGGFSVHNQVRMGAHDAEGRKNLAGYMLRAPMSLEKMRYDIATGSVIYRSKMHLGLKRNFQVMPGAEWLELLLRHVPDRYEHLVRYVGWYSNRARGERAKALRNQDTPRTSTAPVEPVSEFAVRAKAAWARLIRKIYEADPLECPRCKGPMRTIALIDDPGVIRRILEHLGLWAPEVSERSPPHAPEAWPADAVIPLPLTYHPAPDIALPRAVPAARPPQASRPAGVVAQCLNLAAGGAGRYTSGDPAGATPSPSTGAPRESKRRGRIRPSTANQPDLFSYPSAWIVLL